MTIILTWFIRGISLNFGLRVFSTKTPSSPLKDVENSLNTEDVSEADVEVLDTAPGLEAENTADEGVEMGREEGGVAEWPVELSVGVAPVTLPDGCRWGDSAVISILFRMEYLVYWWTS